MVDRVPDEAIADDRRLHAELAHGRGFARAVWATRDASSTTETAILLGADGVHPDLVAATTSNLSMMRFVASPKDALAFIDGADLPPGECGGPVPLPGRDDRRRCDAVTSPQRIRGREVRRLPQTNRPESVFAWPATSGRHSSPGIGAMCTRSTRRCQRAREAARGSRRADRSRNVPRATHPRYVVQAMETLAEAARGQAPDADLLRLKDRARRQGHGSGDLHHRTRDWRGASTRRGSSARLRPASSRSLTRRPRPGTGGRRRGERSRRPRRRWRRATSAEARRRVESVGRPRRGTLIRRLRLGHTHVLRAELALVEHERGAAATIHTALEHVAGRGYRFLTVDILELITALAGDAQDHQEVARLAGALHGIRERLGIPSRAHWASVIGSTA